MPHKLGYEVLGIGAPCVDYILQIDYDYLNTIPGEKEGMIPVEYEQLVKIISESKVEPTIVAGGSCCNTIKGLAKLGTPSAITGKIGSDPAAERFINTLNSYGVTTLFIPSTTPTAQIACLVTQDGKRTFRAYLGACVEMKATDLKPHFFDGIRLLHIEGYALNNERGDLVKKAMEYAKKNKALISLDLASFEMVGNFKEMLLNLIPKYVDILFANELETKALTGAEPEMGAKLMAELCPVAVVLRGSEGCLVAGEGKEWLCPAVPASVLDTTGAGDLFASGFLHAYLKGLTLKECGFYGTVTGGAVVEVLGTDIEHDRWIRIMQHLK